MLRKALLKRGRNMLLSGSDTVYLSKFPLNCSIRRCLIVAVWLTHKLPLALECPSSWQFPHSTIEPEASSTVDPVFLSRVFCLLEALSSACSAALLPLKIFYKTIRVIDIF
jgi:hypothetical protein